jgi:hypothetical protein
MVMNRILFLFICNAFFILSARCQEFIFPAHEDWNQLKEGQTLQFTLLTSEQSRPTYSIEAPVGLGVALDTLGNFTWTPSYDLVNRLEKQKEVTVYFQANWKDGKRIRKSISLVVNHQNRMPAVDELPAFYVKQSFFNQYQISSDYVTDPDGDPIVFKPIVSQMPEGANLTSQGLFTWSPSRNQFNSLKKSPLVLEFIVQDQPEKMEAIGKIKIAPTQLDLPPELLLVPSDSILTIKEDQRINFKIYISDPNGDEDVSNTDFICSDNRVPKASLVMNTPVQAEFTWSPGYYFVEEVEKEKTVELLFFTLDKSANRVQRKVKVKVVDAENLDEKDKLLYIKYTNSLTSAKALLDELEKNHEALTKAYKQAKKGKKNRAIMNASLGATTGLAPVTLSSDPNTYKTVSAIGGTAVLTLGTLEATEVIGKSKADILEKLKTNVEIRNQLQLEGDSFARKYATKSARREKSFDVDRDKLLPILNSQKLVTLELDASKPTPKGFTAKELKKTFGDFSEE